MSIVRYTNDIFKEPYFTTLDRNYIVQISYKKYTSWYHPKTDGAIINIFENCCPLHVTAKRIENRIYFIFDSKTELNTFIKNVKEKFPNSQLYINESRNLWK